MSALDPDYRAWDIVCCPECGNTPADSRVVGRTNLGGGIREEKIFCDRCDEIYGVVVTADE